MAVRKDRIIEFSNRHKLDARVEFYTCADEVVEDCRHRTTHISGYEVKDSRISSEPSFFGVKSYDEALSLLRNGYQAPVEEFREELKAELKDGPRFSFGNEIQGFAPVVPLALKCVPNCMINMHTKPIKTKVLDVYYDMTANCGTEVEEFLKAGKALLGAIIELEKAGYRFNLFAVQSYYGESRNTADFLCVKIKSSNKPLDLKRMSFPLTHTAFFRVIGFDWQGKSPITRDLGSGRGQDLGRHYNGAQLNKIAVDLFGNNACYIACSNIIDSDYDREALKERFTNVSHNK